MTAEVLSRTAFESLVAAAVMAPSVLNTQPWRFVAHGGVIDVHADLRRHLVVSDPHGRALTLSCGAAVLNLRVAVTAIGREPVVHLLPRRSDPGLLARVRIAGQREPTPEDLALYDAVARRRTNRGPFRSERPPTSVLGDLEQAAAAEGQLLRVLTREEVPRVIALLEEANRAQRADALLRAEVRRWTGRGPGSPDGLPPESLGPVARDPRSATRDFAFGEHLAFRLQRDFEAHPLLAVLFSYGPDNPSTWLRAGQAMQRVLLTATAANVDSQMLTQAVEVPDLRWLLRSPAQGAVAPQAVMRLGYGEPVPATPRRSVREVLQVQEGDGG